jgi:hypothetical protein
MSKYRTVQHYHRCACGQKAIKHKTTGFVCERCDRLEQAREQNELRRDYAGRYRAAGSHTLKDRDACDCFVCRVIEKAHEIIVQGEGEYHLSIV